MDQKLNGEAARVSVKLREWRTYRGLSQYALADLAGVSRKTIIALERGYQDSPWPRTLANLAAALGVQPYELLAAPPALNRNTIVPADQSRAQT